MPGSRVRVPPFPPDFLLPSQLLSPSTRWLLPELQPGIGVLLVAGCGTRHGAPVRSAKRMSIGFHRRRFLVRERSRPSRHAMPICLAFCTEKLRAAVRRNYSGQYLQENDSPESAEEGAAPTSQMYTRSECIDGTYVTVPLLRMRPSATSTRASPACTAYMTSFS